MCGGLGRYNCIYFKFSNRVWLPRDTPRDILHPMLGSNTSIFTSQEMEQLSHTSTSWPVIADIMTTRKRLLPTHQTYQASCPYTSTSPSHQLHFIDGGINEGIVLTGFGQLGHFFGKFECCPRIYVDFWQKPDWLATLKCLSVWKGVCVSSAIVWRLAPGLPSLLPKVNWDWLRQPWWIVV